MHGPIYTLMEELITLFSYYMLGCNAEGGGGGGGGLECPQTPLRKYAICQFRCSEKIVPPPPNKISCMKPCMCTSTMYMYMYMYVLHTCNALLHNALHCCNSIDFGLAKDLYSSDYYQVVVRTGWE